MTTSDRRTTASEALFERARAVTPGGVNSPVRAFNAVGGTPRFIRSARGAWLTDVDGNEYVDLVCSWGAMLLGHAHPEVQEAVAAAVARGTSYGTPTEPEVELAEEIVGRTPIDQVRFVSSGTEATMSAIRLARGVTGRDVVSPLAVNPKLPRMPSSTRSECSSRTTDSRVPSDRAIAASSESTWPW